jgi:ABC-type dipeptide/oligopeptide/nickel transport system permease component/ABC-type transport system substrate-binding protein
VVKKTRIWKYGFALLIAFLAFALVLEALAWLFRPTLSEKPIEYTPEEIAQAKADRDTSFDPAHPPSLYVDVDYSKGRDAAWYPKGESPILAELVKEGKLPPVDQRVPEEPLVMRGCDGIGRYGGTWVRVASAIDDINIINSRISYAAPLRWSPLGYPLVPHVAKEVTASPDRRVYTMTLRKGMKWSDGVPFTSRDILYRWECEVNDPSFMSEVPGWMRSGGKLARLEAPDDLHVKFIFDVPNGLFFETLAFWGYQFSDSPEHYLRPYHPIYGDKELIERTMQAYRMPSPRALYTFLKDYRNPEHPHIWPWVPRIYKGNPPVVFVRNPYYFAVDAEGNQLPYVDRLQFEVQEGKMLAVSASTGLITMQVRNIRYEDYTELMSRREEAGTRILNWYQGIRSTYLINPNLVRRVDPKRPDTRWKAQLLGDKRFRQALSLAINRQEIINAETNGQGVPSQIDPGPESPYHLERLAKAYVEYDPARANRLLDEIGLTGRDMEGYRAFPDGTRMTFYLDFCEYTGPGPAEFVCEYWGAVGVRCLPRNMTRPLFYAVKQADDFDFNVWMGESEFLPLIVPRNFMPVDREAFYAAPWGRWYFQGGLYGDPKALYQNAQEPPKGHPLRHAMEVYERARSAPTFEEQHRIFMEVLDIAAENLWTINISSPPPQPVVVKKGFLNVPRNAITGYLFHTPGNAGPETFFFESPADSPGAAEEVRRSMLEIVPKPGALAVEDKPATTGGLVGSVLKWLFIGCALVGAVLVVLRHPYVGKRLAIMVPTLLIISAVVYAVVEMPPGDFLTTRTMALQASGDPVNQQEFQELKRMFWLDQPAWERYGRWMGLPWFLSFERKDMGLLQGYMGREMQLPMRTVNVIIGNRIMLTVLISLGTILFTWIVALPIGIYSAVRQHSFGDYVLTFLGFIGMCVPAFLLALILMTLTGVSGLFSPEYAVKPEWSWGKAIDLMKHIWIPILVLGVSGTAAMIRVMRGNLLDELRKPYVAVARAKGVHPVRLLLKYPVRMALNPFISGIGALFPQLVSGGAIVAIVLSLPTVGPMLLQSLISQETQIAASMLMVLSVLGVFGTLVSDLLLLWLDPRIRFKGGTR